MLGDKMNFGNNAFWKCVAWLQRTHYNRQNYVKAFPSLFYKIKFPEWEVNSKITVDVPYDWMHHSSILMRRRILLKMDDSFQ